MQLRPSKMRLLPKAGMQPRKARHTCTSPGRHTTHAQGPVLGNSDRCTQQEFTAMGQQGGQDSVWVDCANRGLEARSAAGECGGIQKDGKCVGREGYG
mmetsp:Transcript_6969/g.18718  ORF Transcript_6969/g.18718 Transcript_6969/m.18718 type:complete len:98 (-) Transcript_6969:333-626(-)|eukprot:scaffold142641_cov16-Tisochrysis_lutea.AAC.1